MTDLPLAALVPTDYVGAAIDTFRDAGVYDTDRRITVHDDRTVAVPVSSRPTGGGYEALVVQGSPERRRSDLASHLRARGFTTREIERAPTAWGVVGDVVLVEFPAACRRREAVAAALLELHGNAHTVLSREGIEGRCREPTVAVVAGEGPTETVHREHGVTYALDLAAVMFSPGNQAERARMGRVVSPGEHVFDMFAGIGYFALPMAVAGARVTATEINPDAFDYLLENRDRNDVQDRISPYLADCRTVRTAADRVVLGHYDGPAYLESALDALRPGGTLHCHAAVRLDRRDEPRRRLERLVDGRDRALESVSRRTVKTTGERWEHVVLDARVD